MSEVIQLFTGSGGGGGSKAVPMIIVTRLGVSYIVIGIKKKFRIGENVIGIFNYFSVTSCSFLTQLFATK